MSVFKEGEHWRQNERDQVVKYFTCNLKERLTNHAWLNETKLALVMGKSKVTISDWVSGYRMPPSDEQEIIASLLGAKNRAEIWQFKGNGNLQKKMLALFKAHQKVAELENDVHAIVGVNANEGN
jgi:transcriptional regulator with XRE-family HTH domain